MHPSHDTGIARLASNRSGQRASASAKRAVLPAAPETLARSVAADSQSADYKEELALGRFALRVEIRSDSYRNQCHARVSLLSRELPQWTVLDFLHANEMATPLGLSVEAKQLSNAGQSASDAIGQRFATDRDRLVRSACALLERLQA